jgi:hypothetical protein
MEVILSRVFFSALDIFSRLLIKRKKNIVLRGTEYIEIKCNLVVCMITFYSNTTGWRGSIFVNAAGCQQCQPGMQ